MRVLLIEDDDLLGDGLRVGLTRKGFTVDWVKSGRAALHALELEEFDVAILDLGLPDISGTEVVRATQDKSIGVPILILTARDAVTDKLQCLDGGADDYIVKPVDIRELAARLRALARRREGRREAVIHHQNLELDPAAHTVKVENCQVTLSHREFAILHALLRAKGTVLSQAHLQQVVYGWEFEVESNALQVHLHNLRKKLPQDMIRTVRGVGYMVERETG